LRLTHKTRTFLNRICTMASLFHIVNQLSDSVFNWFVQPLKEEEEQTDVVVNIIVFFWRALLVVLLSARIVHYVQQGNKEEESAEAPIKRKPIRSGLREAAATAVMASAEETVAASEKIFTSSPSVAAAAVKRPDAPSLLDVEGSWWKATEDDDEEPLAFLSAEKHNQKVAVDRLSVKERIAELRSMVLEVEDQAAWLPPEQPAVAVQRTKLAASAKSYQPGAANSMPVSTPDMCYDYMWNQSWDALGAANSMSVSTPDMCCDYMWNQSSDAVSTTTDELGGPMSDTTSNDDEYFPRAMSEEYPYQPYHNAYAAQPAACHSATNLLSTNPQAMAANKALTENGVNEGISLRSRLQASGSQYLQRHGATTPAMLAAR